MVFLARTLTPAAAVLAFALILGAFALALGAAPGDIDWGDDSSGYLLQARALASGDPQAALDYGRFRYDASTRELMIGPPIYPWGLPLLFAPFVAAGAGPDGLQWLIGAFHLGAIGAAFALFRDRLPAPVLAAVLATLSVAPGALDVARSVSSDTPFAALALAALFFFRKATTRGRVGPLALAAPLAFGALAGLAVEMRASGLAFLVAAPLAQAAQAAIVFGVRGLRDARAIPRARWTEWAAVYLAFLAVLVAFAWLPGAWGALRYKDHFAFADAGAFLMSVARMGLYYADLPDGYFALPNAAVFTFALLAPLAVAGVIARAREEFALALFVAVYLGANMALPFENGVRIIIAIMPVYLYFAAAGALAIEKIAHDRRPVATIGGAALFAAAVAASSAHGLAEGRGRVVEGPLEPAAHAMFEIIRETTAPESAIVFFKPRALTLHTARAGILALDAPSIIAGPADYALVYRGAEGAAINARIAAAAAAAPARFALVARNEKFQLYAVRRETPAN